MSALDSRLVCTGCGTALAPDTPRPFRCPRAGQGARPNGIDHVLERQLDLGESSFPMEGDENPFVRFRELLHSYRFARRKQWTDAEYVELVRKIDRNLPGSAGFRFTPYAVSGALARELGIASLAHKLETQGVGGSHKARHLMGVALQLRVSGAEDVRLAIASCGNAAIGAACVAGACGWPLEAFVPPDAAPAVLAELAALRATTSACPRTPGAKGDPCLTNYREAVNAGAVPFSVQGTENGLVIEGGETIVWELLTQHAAAGNPPIDCVVIQVGGGALGTACVQAFREALELGVITELPRFHFVQPEGGHPLERAWRRLAAQLVPGASTKSDRDLAAWLHENADEESVRTGLAAAAVQPARYMTPWERAPVSIATGILDDETYDWRALVRAMFETGGRPLVVSEQQLLAARDLARTVTDMPIDATGAAGLAGLLQLKDEGALPAATSAAVLFTGAER